MHYAGRWAGQYTCIDPIHTYMHTYMMLECCLDIIYGQTPYFGMGLQDLHPMAPFDFSSCGFHIGAMACWVKLSPSMHPVQGGVCLAPAGWNNLTLGGELTVPLDQNRAIVLTYVAAEKIISTMNHSIRQEHSLLVTN